MNGVNLEQFQFEYDLTWMSFFQDATGRTYTRYGGRDDAGPESYLNKASLLRTMRSVLELHKTNSVQPSSRYEPVATRTRTPADLPAMKPMIAKRKESCIHCHDVKVAHLRHLHELGKLKKDMVFTYPAPHQLGLTVDPRRQRVITQIQPQSPAAVVGLHAGDVLLESNGQRIHTYADFTRVLELAPATGELALKVKRGDETREHTLTLPAGWRNSKDPSWRASLHVVGPGAGFWGRPANEKERKALQLDEEDLALKVTFIWAPHAKAAKMRNGDFVVNLDGQKHHMTMRQVHAFLHLNREWGDDIELQVMRDGKPLTLSMQLPSEPPAE